MIIIFIVFPLIVVYTALMIMVKPQITSLLLNAGADPNLQSGSGVTPLMCAISDENNEK